VLRLGQASGAAAELADDFERWITLRNGKRIKIDEDGRIVAGLPERYHGVSIRGLSKLSHEERTLQEIDCGDVGAAGCPTCRQTFRTKDEAAAAVLAANPRFNEISQSEFGDYDSRFLKWQRGGRVGQKPRTKITDGRLDSINEYYDLKGAHRVGSFTEALYHAIPSSKRWADLEERLGPLGEMAGMEIHLPEEALQLQAAKLSVEECEREVDERLAQLFGAAREGTLTEGGASDAPF
jgi:hypothetical protein